jgi:glycolate oxidase
LSGEHGIGVEKLLEMPIVFSEAELQVMGYIRNAFNPDGLCNPGKLVPMPTSCGESGMRPLLRHTLAASC